MSGPNINISSNPDYVADGGFGVVIQSTNTPGLPAAMTTLAALVSYLQTIDLLGA